MMQYDTTIELGIRGAVEAAVVTILATLVLEVVSLETVRKLHREQSDGPSLYRSAVAVNFFNHFCLGIPVYVSAVILFCTKPSDDNYDSFLVLSVARVLAILLVHALSYYHAHKMMHTVPGWYQYHRFHHRFRQHIPPMAANAVSIVEYLLAYVLPFALAAGMVRPTETELRLAVYVVSINNLLIHTPAWDRWASNVMPPFWVSTADHTQHHREWKVKYAAPTLNIDWIVEQWNNNKW